LYVIGLTGLPKFSDVFKVLIIIDPVNLVASSICVVTFK
jgi:hypothetical protein